MDMIARLNLCALALSLSLAAGSALAQTPPAAPPAQVGMVDNPCPVDVRPPQPVVDYMKAIFDAPVGAPRPTPTAEQIAALGKMKKSDDGKDDWANLCRYRADDARLAAGPAKTREVVFMGDSITELWAVAHPDFFAEGRIDRGISGQTTPQMLVRFEKDVVSLQPRVVHILGGTNDIAGNTGADSFDQVQDNIVAMVEIAKAHRIQVILAAVPPAAKFTWAPNLAPADKVRRLNTWLKDFAAREHLVFADYYTPLTTPEGGMRPEFTLDGVHPNRAGYAVMEPVTRKAITEALR